MSKTINYEPSQRKAIHLRSFRHTLTESTSPTSHYISHTQTSLNMNSMSIQKPLSTRPNQLKYKTKFNHIQPFNVKTISNSSRAVTPSDNSRRFSFSTKLQVFINHNGLMKLKPSQLNYSALKVVRENKSGIVTKPKLNNKFIPKQPYKYPMIFNPKVKVSLYNYHEIINYVQKKNVLSKKALTKESESKFEEPYSLINKNKFSKKHQLIFEYDPRLTDFEKENKKMNTNINESIKVRGGAEQQVNYIHIDEHKKRRQFLLNRFKMVIIRAAIHFKKLNIDIHDFYKNYKQNLGPFVNKQTQFLISAIKEKNYKETCKLLSENKYLALDFDYFKQTPLHWACKRNFFQVILLLISCGAITLNAVDSVLKTPLHYAIEFNHYEAVVLLLMEGASPFKIDLSGKNPSDYCKTRVMKSICKRAMLLHGIHLLGKQKDFYINIKRGFLYFIVYEIGWRNLDKELFEQLTKIFEKMKDN